MFLNSQFKGVPHKGFQPGDSIVWTSSSRSSGMLVPRFNIDLPNLKVADPTIIPTITKWLFSIFGTARSSPRLASLDLEWLNFVTRSARSRVNTELFPFTLVFAGVSLLNERPITISADLKWKPKTKQSVLLSCSDCFLSPLYHLNPEHLF